MNTTVKQFVVLLEDDTTGDVTTTEEWCQVGLEIMVSTADENGNHIFKTGKIKEILTSKELWE